MQRHDGNGINFDGTVADCDVCALGKGQQLAHPKKAQHAGITRPFQLCYGDSMGPFTPEAYGGFKYVSKITDQSTRWTAVYLLENKSYAFDSFRLFVSSTVIPCGSRVIRWRADKGGEYTSEEFKQYCLETGITQEFAATNTPQQNGVFEHVGRTLCSTVRCLLVDSELSPKLWGELMLTAAYICNRIPHSGLHTETPFKPLYGKETNLSYVKTIGARAFVHIKDAKKLEPKSWEGMLCGFSEDEALYYRVWNPNTRRVVESRNVTFIETPPRTIPQPTRLSPLRELPPAELVDDSVSTDDLLRDARDYTAVLDFNVNIPAEHANVDSVDGGPGMESILEQIRDVTRKDLLISPGKSSSGGASSGETLPGGTLPETSSPSSAPDPMPAGDQAAPAPSPVLSLPPSEAAVRRTARSAPRSEPALTRAHAASVPPRRQTRSGTASPAALFEQRTLHNLRSFALYTNVETQDIAHHLENASLLAEYAYVSTASAGNHSGEGNKLKVPNTFKEAMSLPQAARRKAAADKEIASLKKHGVYELVPSYSVPAGQKLVGSRWVMEAELVAAATAMKKSLFCRNIMMELGFTEEFRGALVYIDNTSALHVVGNKTFSPWAKHIALRYVFVQELVKEGKVPIHFVKTEQQLDLGTKRLKKHRHHLPIKLINEFRA